MATSKLTVSLRAETKQFEKDLKRCRKRHKKTLKKMRKARRKYGCACCRLPEIKVTFQTPVDTLVNR